MFSDPGRPQVARTLVGELAEHVGRRVTLMGWLHRQRRLSQVSFLIVRDRSGLGQVVVEDAGQAAQTAGLAPETVLAVSGEVVAAAQAPGGAELHRPQIEVIAAPVEQPPLELWRPTLSAQLPTLLDLAPLALRHTRHRAIFEVAAASVAGFREALDRLGFTEIQTPKIVGSATESGANVFALDYFGRPAYLAQSPQFYKQTMVGVFERVFEVGPVFRAEPHDTTRHINEYVSLDAEFGFIENHFTVMALLRDVVAGIISSLSEYYSAELELLHVQMPAVPEEIPYVHFADAQELIYKLHGVDVRGEPDLSPQDERWLGEWAQREYGSEFLYVTGYPMRKRPFYTYPDPQRPEYSNSFDLLFRGSEMVTGGQRLHRYEDYLAALGKAHLPLEPFACYLEAFRYGMPPEGGFAIGLERWLMQLTGAANVKLVTLFPRDLNRLVP